IARPELTDGQLVAVVAHAEGSAQVADMIESPPGDPQAPPAPAADALRTKALVNVVAKDGSVLTLQPIGGGLGTSTLTADLESVHLFHSDGTSCRSVDLDVGQGVGVMVVRASPDSPWEVSDLIFP